MAYIENNTQQRLREYIDDEVKDSLLYRELAKSAPDETSRRILEEMADDDMSHADEFGRVYRSMTGRSHKSEAKPEIPNASFEDILRERILDESGDYKKYLRHYMSTSRGDALRNALFSAATDENTHALNLIFLLT